MRREAEQAGRDACGPSLLVLHINDSTDDQVLFQAAAKQAGVPLEFHVADSVKGGISYLRSLVELNAKHAVRWVDLVLLDVVMHDDSGLRVLEYIRQTPELRALPVIAFTGQMDPTVLKEAYDLGVNAIHEKPVSFKDCVELARSLYDLWSSALRPSL